MCRSFGEPPGGAWRLALDDLWLARSGMTTDEIVRYYADVHAFYDRLPPDRFPSLARVAPAMTGHGAEERFEFGLDLLIAGMEAMGRSE